MSSRPEGPGAVATALRANREGILRAFTTRARRDPEVPHADPLSERALRDHAPKMLDDIATLLEHCASTGCKPEEAGRALGDSDSAQQHAWQRLSERYALEEILRELSQLRMAIDDVLSAEVALDWASLRVIQAALDEGMVAGAVAAHERATAQLKEEATLRERLMAVLGHDLRQPLSTVTMGAGLLLRQSDVDPTRTRVVQNIARAGHRMSAMIETLLDVARIREAGGIPVEREPVDLREVIDRVADEVALSRGEGWVRVSGPPRCSVRGDAGRLAQVVSNLISNAIDHGAPSSEIRVSLEPGEDAVVISVENQNAAGPIDPARIATLFEPFQRGHGGPASGLGLGLYIAREIARGHGGDIEVASDAQRTAVRVILPRER